MSLIFKTPWYNSESRQLPLKSSVLRNVWRLKPWAFAWNLVCIFTQYHTEGEVLNNVRVALIKVTISLDFSAYDAIRNLNYTKLLAVMGVVCWRSCCSPLEIHVHKAHPNWTHLPSSAKNWISNWIQRLTGFHRDGLNVLWVLPAFIICGFKCPICLQRNQCLQEKFKYIYSQLKCIIIAALGQQIPFSGRITRPMIAHTIEIVLSQDLNKKKPCWLLSRSVTTMDSKKYNILSMPAWNKVATGTVLTIAKKAWKKPEE